MAKKRSKGVLDKVMSGKLSMDLGKAGKQRKEGRGVLKEFRAYDAKMKKIVYGK